MKEVNIMARGTSNPPPTGKALVDNVDTKIKKAKKTKKNKNKKSK